VQGLTALAACLAVYLVARPTRGDDAARALTFAALVVAFVAVILVNRSWTVSILGSLRRPDPAHWWVLGNASAFLGTALLGMALFWSMAQRLFHFAPIHALDLLLACLTGFASVLWFGGFKLMRHPPCVAVIPLSN
jgi:Ca2+-transporting ATPase